MHIQDASLPRSKDVAEKGWSYGRLTIPTNGDWHEFAKAWEDLPIDPYVRPGHQTTRYRRLGRLLARNGHGPEQTPHEAFFQSSDINAVYGGQARIFAPILPETHENSCFQLAVEHDLDLIRRVDGTAADWQIAVHLIRILAAGSAISAPAPEGRHSDGHDYVIMHLINRQHCTGGISRLFRKGEDEPLLRHTLAEPMETLVLDDRTLEHEVTPISPDSTRTAIRDMMIVDFERT